ncbi:MAG: hypothetical protein AAB092_02170 [Chloroflexota bacterium]
MTEQPAPKLPRAILASFPKEYLLPGKPASASAQVLDAHRQTGFLLGDDLALFERAMNLQLSLIAANSKVRGMHAAAMFSLWSRTFTNLADACTLMSQGSYGSCPPLVRVALDAIAVQRSLIADGFEEYEEWYRHAVTQDREHAAVLIDTGHYKAASVLVSDARLGELYRLLMDLSLPHFGSALFLAAPETNLQKVPLAFADNSFHLGLGQLAAGWLLLLSGEQLTTALTSGVFDAHADLHAANDALQRDIAQTLSDTRRCYVERADERWIIHNFRRGTAGQPKRIVLGS